jgi:hypothetical protein
VVHLKVAVRALSVFHARRAFANAI